MVPARATGARGAAAANAGGDRGGRACRALLSHLLAESAIESVVLERRSREYAEHRVRAGVLEHSTAELLVAQGVGTRMRSEGLVHHGIELRFAGRSHRLPLSELAGGRSLVVYGQQEVVKDLVAARLAAGGDLRFETEVTGLEEFDDPPRPTGDATHGPMCRLAPRRAGEVGMTFRAARER
jgi:2-polyprenyl-6-methoxyphenol hydroxylase-like FAD-dependent oxidoreductase